MNKPILIIGDSCQDIFVYCKCDRLCPEAPVPVLDILTVRENGGMAMNVYENLKKLTLNTEIITNKQWNKITKTRYVDVVTNQMFIRIDNTQLDDSFKNVRAKINFKDYSAIIISDYHKGFLTEDDIEYIANKHPLTFLDTKKPLNKWSKNIAFIKINRKEYDASLDFIKRNKDIANKIIKTVGDVGAEYRGKVYPVKKVEVKDLSGAGDTFLASLTYGYLKYKNIAKAIEIANKHATIVVQKKGVCTI